MTTTKYGPEACGPCGGRGCETCNYDGSVMVAQPAQICTGCGGRGCKKCRNCGWANYRGF